jgi:hypothetical protein
VDHAEERADRETRAQVLPRFELFPCPDVHSDLAALVAFPVADEDSSAAGVHVGLSDRERFADLGRMPTHAQAPASGSFARRGSERTTVSRRGSRRPHRRGTTKGSSSTVVGRMCFWAIARPAWLVQSGSVRRSECSVGVCSRRGCNASAG